MTHRTPVRADDQGSGRAAAVLAGEDDTEGARMNWDRAELGSLAEAEELHISTYRRDGSLRRWTPIWIVRVGDGLYVRSAFGAEGGWYRNAMRRGVARIRAGGVERDVTLAAVSDSDTVGKVAAAYHEKYADQPSSLRTMLAEPSASTTTRLDPSA